MGVGTYNIMFVQLEMEYNRIELTITIHISLTMAKIVAQCGNTNA